MSGCGTKIYIYHTKRHLTLTYDSNQVIVGLYMPLSLENIGDHNVGILYIIILLVQEIKVI